MIIVPTSIDHYADLHAGLHEPSVLRTFRWRGEPIPADRFEAALFDRASLSWTVISSHGQIVGLVQVVGINAADRVGELVAAAFSGSDVAPLGEAILLAVDEAFHQRDLRKLYVHVSEDVLASLSTTLGRVVEVEGVLREHLWLDGRHQDVTIGAIRRADFERMLGASPARRMTGEWKVLDRADEPNASLLELDDLLVAILGRGAEDDAPLEPVTRDSLALVEVLCLLDDLAGHEVAVDAVIALRTIGDLRRLVTDLTR